MAFLFGLIYYDLKVIIMVETNLYCKVGIILELIQKWEYDFKLVTVKFGIEKSDDKRSLSNMNSFLFRNGFIGKEDFELIKKIIEDRNVVIHRYFIDKVNEEFLDKFLEVLNESKRRFKQILM